jgi:hypothetical protein
MDYNLWNCLIYAVKYTEISKANKDQTGEWIKDQNTKFIL